MWYVFILKNQAIYFYFEGALNGTRCINCFKSDAEITVESFHRQKTRRVTKQYFPTKYEMFEILKSTFKYIFCTSFSGSVHSSAPKDIFNSSEAIMFPPVSLFSPGCFCVILVSNKPTNRFLQSLDEDYPRLNPYHSWCGSGRWNECRIFFSSKYGSLQHFCTFFLK